MGFWDAVVDWVPLIGKAAIGFLPGGGVATTVIEGIGKIADIVGGDEGRKIEGGLNQITDGLKSIGDKPLSSEAQVQLSDNKTKLEIKLAEVALKEKQLPFEDQAGGREVVITALKSGDKVVRQARSKMMLLLGRCAIGYTLITPIFILIGCYLKLSDKMLELLIEIIIWQGGMMWGSFTTSFGGYTVAKYNEKRIAKGIPSSRALKTMAKLGQLVS